MSVTDRARAQRGTPATGVAAPNGAVRALGLGAVIAGAFGALVPFLGPLIGLNMGMSKAWELTAGRAVLHVIPGLIGIAGGMALLRASRRLTEGGGWGAVVTAALVVLAGGMWFIVGPDAWPVIDGSGGGGMMNRATLASLVSTLAYHSGPGLLLSAFGAAGVGLAGRRSAG